MKSKNQDKNLLDQLKNKDKEAFAATYDAYVEKIYRFVYFKIGNQEVAEDLTSSVFLKAWNHIQENNLKDIKGLKALLYAIARNIIIDEYRKQSSRNEVQLQTEEVENIPDPNIELADKFDKTIKNNFVAARMLKLKDEYREIIMLRFIEEYSIGEIAEIVGKPKGSVRVTLHRALSALRDLCSDEEKLQNNL